MADSPFSLRRNPRDGESINIVAPIFQSLKSNIAPGPAAGSVFWYRDAPSRRITCEFPGSSPTRTAPTLPNLVLILVDNFRRPAHASAEHTVVGK